VSVDDRRHSGNYSVEALGGGVVSIGGGGIISSVNLRACLSLAPKKPVENCMNMHASHMSPLPGGVPAASCCREPCLS